MVANEIPIAGYESKLLSRVEVAEGTMAFHFEKPSGFNFKAGQSADVTLTDPPGKHRDQQPSFLGCLVR